MFHDKSLSSKETLCVFKGTKEVKIGVCVWGGSTVTLSYLALRLTIFIFVYFSVLVTMNPAVICPGLPWGGVCQLLYPLATSVPSTQRKAFWVLLSTISMSKINI